MSCVGGAGWQGFLLIDGRVLPYTSAEINSQREITTPGHLGNPTYRYLRTYALGKHQVIGKVSGQFFYSHMLGFKSIIQKVLSNCPFTNTLGGISFSPANGDTYF